LGYVDYDMIIQKILIMRKRKRDIFKINIIKTYIDLLYGIENLSELTIALFGSIANSKR